MHVSMHAFKDYYFEAFSAWSCDTSAVVTAGTCLETWLMNRRRTRAQEAGGVVPFFALQMDKQNSKKYSSRQSIWHYPIAYLQGIPRNTRMKGEMEIIDDHANENLDQNNTFCKEHLFLRFSKMAAKPTSTLMGLQVDEQQ